MTKQSGLTKDIVSVSSTKVRLGQVMLPEDANSAGNVHGGTIMKLVDNAAFVVATRLCGRNVVTVSMDSMDFNSPVYIGNLVILKASVNWTGRTSMEIGVRVESEDLFTGKVRHTATAYLTFVALDENNRPVPVPQVTPRSQNENRRFKEATERAAHRKKKKIKALKCQKRN